VPVTFQLSIPSDYSPIPARFYRGNRDGAPCPLLVYFHGGGFMLGTLALYDTTCRRLALGGDCAVLSVDYRMAPETIFPGAVLDAYAATHWASRNAGLLNIDPAKIAVCGDSAGGNLAAVVAQMAQDSGDFALALQLLIYPMTDQSREYPSYIRNESGYMLTRRALHWFMDAYIPDKADRLDPRASPMLRTSLDGLPPALVISAEFDPLVDENEAYAKKLSDAGVATRYVCFPGMVHPFFTLGGVIEDAAKAESLIAERMRGLA
jgi:acetyl esterase